MKNFLSPLYVVIATVFFAFTETKANVGVDSIKQITTTSCLVYLNWDFNSPDTTGYVGLELSTNPSFTNLISGACPALSYQSLDTGHLICNFTGLTPNTVYYIRATELTPPLSQWRGTVTSFPTAQIYSATQIKIDSFQRTISSMTWFYSFKAGNDTARVKFLFGEDIAGGFVILIPDYSYTTPNTNGWVSGSFTKGGLKDTTRYELQTSITNRNGSVTTSISSGYTLKIPSAPTPYAVTDSAGSIGYYGCTVYGHGWTNTGTFGFKIYPTLSDANVDANSLNIWGVGGVGNFSGAVSLSANPGITKWYRAYVVYNGLTYYGAIQQFTTKPLPTWTVLSVGTPITSTTATGSASIDTKSFFCTIKLKYNGNTTTIGSGVYDGSQSIKFNFVDLVPSAINDYFIGVVDPSGNTTWFKFSIDMGNVQYIPFYGTVSTVIVPDFYNPVDSLIVRFKLKGTCEFMWADFQYKLDPGNIVNSTTQLVDEATPANGAFVYEDINFYGKNIDIDNKVIEFRLAGICQGKPQYMPWTEIDLRISSSVQEVANVEVNIYPNPVMNKLNITLESPEEISLTNLNGQILAKYFGAEISFDMSTYLSGVYIVKGDTFTKKVIKE